ncbi:unnamed protein product [Strongylus vulgaris]|uniref:Uncharacterized protein n=1 Tax=Strongylus vulgaris TaxID=40348 RepID=A0A3P7J1A6_STRVU|nr:unnamed protein product [Strongylus vulgaris]
MNGSKLDPDWTSKFDLVIIFDACHDQMRPDLAMPAGNSSGTQSGRRFWNDRGRVDLQLSAVREASLLQIYGTSNIFQDKKEDGAVAARYYATSLFHCLPIGSNSKGDFLDAFCLGAKWGTKRGVKLLEEAGFKEIAVHRPSYFLHNAFYICKKN